MPSLLVVIFFLQLTIHLVNTVGAATINNILWDIYNCLPTPTSKSAAEQRELKKQFLKVRTELNATSSQDEFAKWAKLRRQHDKLVEQVEANSSVSPFPFHSAIPSPFIPSSASKLTRTLSAETEKLLDGTKQTFDRTVSTLRWLGTNGLRMLIQFWYQKQAMFWIPKGWMPYYAEWLLSFPRAPLGSVSVQAWALACGAVILLVSDAVVGVIALGSGEKVGGAQKEPMKMAGGGEKGKAGASQKAEAKKEL